MPYKKADYKNGVIYKIEHNDKPELIYIGSTTHFIRRKANHKKNCNDEKKKEYNFKLYQMIRDNGGFNEFKIMVIKEYQCNNKIELIIEEEKHRKEFQANLNDRKAHTTYEEAKELKKEYQKNYREDNKEKIKEKDKEHYETNKEKINEQKKEKINCLCGSIFRKCDKARHEKTEKHQIFLNSLLLK